MKVKNDLIKVEERDHGTCNMLTYIATDRIMRMISIDSSLTLVK